eukprot:15646910-Heterocapsa_arctica.AAC.1
METYGSVWRSAETRRHEYGNTSCCCLHVFLHRFGLILCENRSADRCASDGDGEGSVRQRSDP